jgi:hypothetical protein
LRTPRIGLACLMLCAALCVAQTSSQPTQPANSPASSSSGSAQPQSGNAGVEHKKGKADDAGSSDANSSKNRLFFALPNFLTLENGAQAPPLTSGEKFKIVAKGAFDYVQIPWYAALAGIGQARNDEPGFGQGWEGYGKRFGSAFADGTIENFMTGAILPSVLHQDPRYYQMGKGGFLRRATYSATRILITRSDSGHKEFNFSEVFGSAISASISNYSYHPRSDRTISDTAEVWGSQVGYDTITILLKEFWPDIRRKIMKKKKETDNRETGTEFRTP